ncbi:MAG: tyrosine-type recombinase/integrase [Nocardioidaceae bacterium]
MRTAELASLVPSWELHLKAERKSDGTIRTYLAGVEPYLGWCESNRVDPLSRASLQAWTTELLNGGRSAATAKTRMMAVRHFARWLADEGEIDGNPFDKLKPPKVDQPIVPVLTDDQLRALIKACEPPASERQGLASLRHRRDEAIVRLMLETGMRASECLNLELDDVDLVEGTVVIRRGKGGRGRTVPFGPQAARALDRYLRVRRLHALASGPRLWLGDRGRMLAYNGLYWALGQRAAAAGIPDFHPHMLRHTSADRWLAKGGSEVGAMAMHGWSSLDMLQRYGRANRERRAADEARNLNLGEL